MPQVGILLVKQQVSLQLSLPRQALGRLHVAQMPRYQSSNREYPKILTTMCKKALCSIFLLGLPQIFSSHRSMVTGHRAGCAILGCNREHVR
jgi:hypothetical protein